MKTEDLPSSCSKISKFSPTDWARPWRTWPASGKPEWVKTLRFEDTGTDPGCCLKNDDLWILKRKLFSVEFWNFPFSAWHGVGQNGSFVFYRLKKSLIVINKQNNKEIFFCQPFGDWLENMRSFSLWCQADEYWHCVLIMMTNEQWHAAPLTHGGTWLPVFQENNEQIEPAQNWI